MTNEIITLQLGQLPHATGTHWWNILDSSFVYLPEDKSRLSEYLDFRHDILFREGFNAQGHPTFTPRLVAVYQKGTLNCMKEGGTLYETNAPTNDETSQQNLKTTEINLPNGMALAQRNDFLQYIDHCARTNQNLPSVATAPSPSDALPMETEADETEDYEAVNDKFADFPNAYDLDYQISTWSDYLRTELHPKSFSPLNEFDVSNSEANAFDLFGTGRSVMQTHNTTSECIEDNLRFFLEECDSLQGFHILFEPFNGFGGLTSSLLELITEECKGRTMWCFPMYPCAFSDPVAYERERRATRLTASTRSMASVLALSASAMHLTPISLTSRLWPISGDTRSFDHLNFDSKLQYHESAILACALETVTVPYRLKSRDLHMDQYLHSLNRERRISELSIALPGFQSPLTTLLPGDRSSNQTSVSTLLVSRGMPDDSHLRSLEEVNQYFSIAAALPTLVPYPQIFSEEISQFGHLLTNEIRPSNQSVKQVSSVVRLEDSRGTCRFLKDHETFASKLHIKKYPRLMADMELDEFREDLEVVRTQLEKQYDE